MHSLSNICAQISDQIYMEACFATISVNGSDSKELTMFIEEKVYMFHDRNSQSVTSPGLPMWAHHTHGLGAMLDQKGCKPKCRFSQVIILGKYEVDPQGMVDTK